MTDKDSPPPQPKSCLHSCSPRAPRERGNTQDWESGARFQALLCCVTWGCSQTLSHDLQTRQWCWAPEDPPRQPQAGSLEGWNPSLQPDCGVGAEARAQPKRQQTTGQMGQPCARHRGVPLRPPLSSVLAWDAPFLRPFHSHPQGTSRVPPPRPALQGCPCLHCPSGCSGLYPSRRPVHLGPSRAGVCVFPCLRPGSVHVLFSPSGQAAGGRGGEQDSPSSC